MINRILNSLGLGDGSLNGAEWRRRHARHSGQQAQASVRIGNRLYSMRDWSMGGVSFNTLADDTVAVGDRIELEMDFHLPTETVTIVQPVEVVRKEGNGIAAAFAPLTSDVRRRFEKVIDGIHAQSFVESHAVNVA